jgi:hypothetical protein
MERRCYGCNTDVRRFVVAYTPAGVNFAGVFFEKILLLVEMMDKGKKFIARFG